MDLGYKRKKKKQGSISCVKKSTTTRKRHKRVGSIEIEHTPSSKRKCVRQAIFYHFVYVLDAPCKKHWIGLGRTILLIRKALHLDLGHHGATDVAVIGC